MTDPEAPHLTGEPREPTIVSGRDAFRHILTLHDAMLDDARWPATTAMLDEACGLTGNSHGRRRAEGRCPRVLRRALLLTVSAAKSWRASTLRSTTPSTNASRACGGSLTVAWCTSRTSTRPRN